MMHVGSSGRLEARILLDLDVAFRAIVDGHDGDFRIGVLASVERLFRHHLDAMAQYFPEVARRIVIVVIG